MKIDPALADLVGYAVQRAHLTVMDDLRRRLRPFDISPAKLTALLLIRANPGTDQTRLGKALSINRSSAMKLVNVLAERGLVERRPGRDLRSNALHLTEAGSEALTRMVEATRVSDDAIVARLSASERATLLRLLQRVCSTGSRAPRASDAPPEDAEN